MMRAVQLNVMGCTCLIQCLGRVKRTDDLVNVFEFAVQSGVRPDDRQAVWLGCLLSVVSYCDGEDASKVFACLERANIALFAFVKGSLPEFDTGSGNTSSLKVWGAPSPPMWRSLPQRVTRRPVCSLLHGKIWCCRCAIKSALGMCQLSVVV